MKKVKMATVWLDGCSGCHMSLLDMDAAIISLAQKIDLVYGPLVDAQEFPEDVDVTLVEGAVSSQDDFNKLQKIRQRTQVLVALGDCAVTGNVPAMRNSIPVNKLLQQIYVEGAQEGKVVPDGRSACVVKTRASTAGVCESGFMSARMSAAREEHRYRNCGLAGREKARGQPRGEIRMRSVG